MQEWWREALLRAGVPCSWFVTVYGVAARAVFSAENDHYTGLVEPGSVFGTNDPLQEPRKVAVLE